VAAEWWDVAMRYEATRRHERMDELTPEDTGKELVWQRKICWPKPDATCLEGGCIHCDSGAWKNLRTIENYAYRVGIVQNRGSGQQAATRAWRNGVTNGFFGRPRLRLIKVRRRANASTEERDA
jgi:hypothetical protein